jgi:hypothetical protein
MCPRPLVLIGPPRSQPALSALERRDEAAPGANGMIDVVEVAQRLLDATIHTDTEGLPFCCYIS